MRKGSLVSCAALLVGLFVASCDASVPEVDAGSDASELEELDAADGIDAAAAEADAAPSDVGPDGAEAEDASDPADVGEDSWVPHAVECDLYPQARCAEGLGCYPAGHEGSQCARPTAAQGSPGDACEYTNDCAPGSFCGNRTSDRATCEAICPLDGSRCATCVEIPGYRLVPGFGVCR